MPQIGRRNMMPVYARMMPHRILARDMPLLPALALAITLGACGRERQDPPPPSARVPSAPGRPQFTVRSDVFTLVDATWAPPLDDGGRPVTGYYVQTSPDSTNWSAYFDGKLSTVASATFGGDGGPLYVRVVAVNEIGLGPFSDVVSVPLSKISVNVAAGMGGGCLAVDWLLPFSGVGPVADVALVDDVSGTTYASTTRARVPAFCASAAPSCSIGASHTFTLRIKTTAGETAQTTIGPLDPCPVPVPWRATTFLRFPAAPLAQAGGDRLFVFGGHNGSADPTPRAVSPGQAVVIAADGSIPSWSSTFFPGLLRGTNFDGSTFDYTPWRVSTALELPDGKEMLLVAGSVNYKTCESVSRSGIFDGIVELGPNGTASSRSLGLGVITTSIGFGGTERAAVIDYCGEAGSEQIAATNGFVYLIGSSGDVHYSPALVRPDFCGGKPCSLDTTAVPTGQVTAAVGLDGFIYALANPMPDAGELFFARADLSTGALGSWTATAAPLATTLVAGGGRLYNFGRGRIAVADRGQDGSVLRWNEMPAPVPWRSDYAVALAQSGSRMFLYAAGGIFSRFALDVVEFAEVDPATGLLK